MDAGSAFLALAVCMAADELGTRAVLRAGGRETMIQRPAVRIALKVSVLPLFAKKQKRSKLVLVGLPLAYCGAGAFNQFVVLPEQQRRNGGR